MLDIFALLVLLLLAAVGIWLVVLLDNLPGNIAREAGHPQSEAITVVPPEYSIVLNLLTCLAADKGWQACHFL